VPAYCRVGKSMKCNLLFSNAVKNNCRQREFFFSSLPHEEKITERKIEAVKPQKTDLLSLVIFFII
jgi:hypothetical protein